MTKKFKKIMMILGLGTTIVIIGGCSEQTLMYEGVDRPKSEVSEIISDKLEVENPGLDIEVSITLSND